jgi:hypothetical protein
VILGVTSIACLFLFFGLFTTDSSSSNRERRTKPNLGRPEQAAVAPENANRSPVPQLSANQQPNEEPSELSEKDLLATMRNRGTPAPNDATPTPPPKTLAFVRFDDPALAEAYRRHGLTPPSPRTEVAAWDNAKAGPYAARYHSRESQRGATQVVNRVRPFQHRPNRRSHRARACARNREWRQCFRKGRRWWRGCSMQ